MSTVVKGNHPLAEIIARKLSGINSVPDKERNAMVSRCAKAAVGYVEQIELENGRLKKALKKIIKEDSVNGRVSYACRIALEALKETK